MKEIQRQGQEKKAKRKRRLVLFILLIMFLAISQVIFLLANSNSVSVNHTTVSVPVTKQEVTVDDLKEVKADLKQVANKLNSILAKPVEAEIDASEMIPQPVTLKSVKVDTELNTDLKQKKPEFAAVANVETNSDPGKTVPPVAVPPLAVPVVSGTEKQVVNPEETVIENKQLPPVITKSVSTPPLSVTAANNQSDENSAGDAIVNTDTKVVYVKYDSNGNRLKNNDEKWSCVFDTKNGLMWEVKSEDDALRFPDNLYSWFNPDSRTLKGVTDGGRCKGGTGCDTNAYIEAMNRQKFCGHNDWRLPTQQEMLGLVKYGNIDSEVKIDTSYFPHALPSWYWTASTNSSRPEYAWYVLFKNGLPLNDLKENPKHIRLVRNESS